MYDYGLRDKVVSVRVNSELYDKFRKTVDAVESICLKKTNASDLIEKALIEYIKKHDGDSVRI